MHFLSICQWFFHTLYAYKILKDWEDITWPERMILSRIDCYSQYEIVGLEIILEIIHEIRQRPGDLFQSSGGNAVRIFLASALLWLKYNHN